MNRDILERPFEEALLKSRKGPFGNSFTYVEGAEYIRRLNEAFAGEFSFEIVEHNIRDNEVIVLGKLSAAGVTKMAFGGSSITVSREGEIISIADDLKAAATDALKKACSLFGIGLHLYSEPQATESKPAASTRPTAPPSNEKNGSQKAGHARQSAPAPTNGERLTQRQLSAIWSMGRGLNLSAEAIRERALQIHGALPEQLTRAAASAFITELGEALGGNGKSAASP